ncbi:hypothetical protein CLV84_3465 [Neolewinella xylanilytica]|uniref:Outer membrane lipoprotein-sorting protein n=1 Tax=Neolewinella xylanilytica TaxID=1514080 RepID=A0A2S6I5U0_9BACT|nr:hypothetical protein [Neolewinella xylanilytica]PPK86534.1 hypothetical protein CLV84_3465 [Neolewinella xylanilytica]
MKTIYTSILFLSLFNLGSCESNETSTAETDFPETEQAIEEELVPANMAPEFVEVLEAHGGLANWNNLAGLSFLINGFPTMDGDRTISDYHKVNLGSRYHQIEGEGYEIVSRGDTTWVTPDLQVTGVPPRLYQGASFYLMGMPFVFADEGLTVTYAGEAEFGEETVDQFNVQVPDDMGDGGNDYQLYTDPATHQLQYSTFSVNYPAVADMDLRQMVEFNEWQTVDGLIVPSVLVLYTAQGEITEGTPGSTISFERVAFSENPFEDSVFTTPEGALVDQTAYGR